MEVSSNWQSPPSPSSRQRSLTVSGLKARLQNISITLDDRSDILHADKDILDVIKAAHKGSSSLKDSVEEFKRFFITDITRVEEEFNVQVNLQRTENVRIQQQLNLLKAEKTSIHQQLLGIQRRVEEIEEELGKE
jgi:hypothetical protein